MAYSGGGWVGGAAQQRGRPAKKQNKKKPKNNNNNTVEASSTNEMRSSPPSLPSPPLPSVPEAVVSPKAALRLQECQETPADWRLADIVRLKTVMGDTQGKAYKLWSLHFRGGTTRRLRLGRRWEAPGVSILTGMTNGTKAGTSFMLPWNCTEVRKQWPNYNPKIHSAEEMKKKEEKSTNPGENLLNELLAYHVDRVLGFDTVPRGKLVWITPDEWLEWFAEHFCAHKSSEAQFLHDLVRRQRGDLPGLSVVGWLQDYVDDIGGLPRGRLPAALQAACAGNNHSNMPDIAITTDLSDPDGPANFYRFFLVLKLIARIDTTANCFTTLAIPRDTRCEREAATAGTAEWPRWLGSHPRRLINVDNERLGPVDKKPGPGPPAWEKEGEFVMPYPCRVPVKLRRELLRLPSLKEPTLRSIREREVQVVPVPGQEEDRKVGLHRDDLQYLERRLDYAEAVFQKTAAAFRECGDAGP